MHNQTYLLPHKKHNPAYALLERMGQKWVFYDRKERQPSKENSLLIKDINLLIKR